MDGPMGGARGITLLISVAVIAVLHFGQEVFIPLALALLLAFLLGPLVGLLRRLHLGRIPSAVMAVAFAGVVIAAIGTFVTLQLYDLASKLPQYRNTIITKLKTVQVPGGGGFNQALKLLKDTGREMNTAAEAAESAGERAGERPVQVEIKDTVPPAFKMMQRVVGSVLHPLATAGIVSVVLLFVLVYKEDLRDRFLRLVGLGRIHLTTQALDDAAHRVSRYLLMQLVVNVTYGIPAGLGLYFIGVPNPVLWGFLATVFRFIPYLGPVLGASLPLLMAFAVDPGWSMFLSTAALFIVLELVSNNLVEPWLYGSSTGLHPVAVILSAVFWTWLWGPVGLLLSTPLTVCLVVMGRHFPQVGIFTMLLGDEPVLSPAARFYQRLLARDSRTVEEMTEECLKDSSLLEFHDTVLLPALSLAEQDRQRGVLDAETENKIVEDLPAMIELWEDCEENSGETENNDAHEDNRLHPVVCIPARRGPDEMAARIIAHQLERGGVRTRVLSAASLSGEWISEIRSANAGVVCIVTLPPTMLRHVRYRFKRLRTQMDAIPIAVVMPGGDPAVEGVRDQLGLSPRDCVCVSLTESISQVKALALAPAPAAEPVAPPAKPAHLVGV